jgi:hypothetical protein
MRTANEQKVSISMGCTCQRPGGASDYLALANSCSSFASAAALQL